MALQIEANGVGHDHASARLSRVEKGLQLLLGGHGRLPTGFLQDIEDADACEVERVVVVEESLWGDCWCYRSILACSG